MTVTSCIKRSDSNFTPNVPFPLGESPISHLPPKPASMKASTNLLHISVCYNQRQIELLKFKSTGQFEMILISLHDVTKAIV